MDLELSITERKNPETEQQECCIILPRNGKPGVNQAIDEIKAVVLKIVLAKIYGDGNSSKNLVLLPQLTDEERNLLAERLKAAFYDGEKQIAQCKNNQLTEAEREFATVLMDSLD